MAAVATVAVVIALLLDLRFAEPPESIHPVAAFGSILEWLDATLADEPSRPLLLGTGMAVLLPIGYAVSLAAPVWLFERIHPLLGAALAGGLLFTTVSLRMLVTVAGEVVEASTASGSAGRELAIALVGRDTASLSPGQLRSAAVESAAENLADGLVGPLLAFALGSLLSLPVGVGAAAWVKGVNTLDSMFGYPDRAVGTPSARLDDVVEWLPARLSAVLIAIASGTPLSLRRVGRSARVPDSPNSGWPMATLAVAADVRLEKPGAYRLNEGATLPSVERARHGVNIVGRAGLLAFAATGVFVLW